jgi:cell division protein ZapA (FtsZ GTPase activity inhibitor)
MEKQDFWKNKEDRDIAKDKKITRMATLNTAVDIMKMTENFRHVPILKVYSQAKLLAQKIQKYVGDGDVDNKADK